MSNLKYESFFPYRTIRKEQEKAIEYCIEQFKSGKRYVVVEAGTGCGKSAIGLTVSRWLNAWDRTPDPDYEDGTYYVTTQKILQEQYVKDFGSSKGCMKSIKSASNYKCNFKLHKGNSCQDSQRLLRTTDKKSPFFKNCAFSCVYKQAKRNFLESKESVTNFPYFLTEAAFSGKITPRKCLVVDEAHNVETELSKFIEVTVSKRFSRSVMKVSWPTKKTQYSVYKWIRDVYFPRASAKLLHFEEQIENLGIKSKIKDFNALANQYDMLSSHVKKMDTFLKVYQSDNWVLEVVPPKDRAMEKFVFRPIDVAPFVDEYVNRLGKRVVFMSATILDKQTFCRSLGIEPEDTAFISIPTPFPAENRPIIFSASGHMNAKSINATLPKLAKAVSMILAEHKDEKGIIHCHTYKIANYLKQNVRSNRLLIHNSSDRDDVLRKHINSKKPTVLLSPSMSEGVDLHGNLSRFQVICKVPYPYLGDPLIRKRMNKFSGWYPMQVAKTIVQAVGRSVRSKDDKAVTYILDGDWYSFLRKNRKFFPKSFLESLL